MTRIQIIGFLLGISLLLITRYANGAAVMSIDLGSEWMKVGVVSPGVPMEIALNKESKRKTPSVVGIRDGIRVFGEDAQTLGVRFPTNSYSYLVDLLGKQIDNPLVNLYKTRFPYHKLEADPVRNTIVFKNGEDSFTVEELVAQLIQKARDFAEESTNQQITECVIVVPGYFGQAERTAMIAAAALAKVKVLQLINDYSAVALNYGIFRRNEMNETAQYFVFYDMGAYKTSAAVISYQLVKDKQTKEMVPTIQVLGVGYDRILGGLEMQTRLRDHLAKEFNNMKLTKNDVFKNARAMAKLFKEAGRVKNVLSANSDHYAQIEGLLDDKDFRVLVTREQFENLCKDLFSRVTKPLETALKASGLTLDVITQVILFGGNTRVPKIQEVLKNYIKQDLGKNLNADEAATMGAVYKAADLATGFKVKKFVTKDAVLFPIQVIFERETDEGTMKQVKRNLFGAMNSYPQKKVITFNKYSNDFDFFVNYADLDHLPKDEISYLGSLNLTKHSLLKISDVISSQQGPNVEPKGIKAHFALDDSGIFLLTGIDYVVEKQVDQSADEESTLSKLGSTISKLFSSDKETDDKTQGEKTPEEDEKEAEQPSGETKKNETTPEPVVNATETEGVKNATKPKIVIHKEPVTNEIHYLFTVPLDGDTFDQSSKKIDDLDVADRERHRREGALNSLESFVIDAQMKMDQEEYSECGTEEEIAAVLKACSETSEWLYEDGENADAVTYEKKIAELKALTDPMFSRHWEHNERPEALKALDKLLEGANGFLTNAKNLTKETNPEKDVFTQVEIDVLEKTITDTKEWIKAEKAAQDLLKKNEPVRLTVKSMTDKMAALDREVKYLVNKLKYWRPKVKKSEEKDKDKKDEDDKANEESSGKKEGDENENEDEEKKDSEEPTVQPDDEVEDTGEAPDSSDEEVTETPHTEL